MSYKDEINRLYDYKDGTLTRKVRSGSAMPGKVSGWPNGNGYLRARAGNKQDYIHRLVYIMHNGDIKKGFQIDHMDGNRRNNRIENLRAVTSAENSQNKQKVKGCFYSKEKRRWESQINANNIKICLGGFETKEQARAAYIEAKKIYHPTAPELEK